MTTATPPSIATTPLRVWMQETAERFERVAGEQLPLPAQEPQRLHVAMRYAVLDGGKRARPLLVYAAGECFGAPREALDAAALAVEYVHAYSLVHDDLPCMDNDILRRGKPTVHIAFDEATAMLAGDALQAEAFKVLAEARAPDGLRSALVRELAHAASTRGMCGGQALDLDAVGVKLDLQQLERMHRMKTGALLQASVRMGALVGIDAAGPAAQFCLAAIDEYGRAIGLAFQVVDDILDVEGTAESLGKTAGKDAQQDKPTYVSLLGLEQSKQWAVQLRKNAYRALDALGPWAQSAERLRQLADYIVLRSS